MMRRYHRWLSVLFGIFMLWIATTGVLSHVGEIVNNGGLESEAERRAEHGLAPAPVAGVPADFKCPETMNCRPKPQPGKWNIGLLHRLHSGEALGPVGTIISILSGLSLIFFAVSGLWMYIELFRGRLAKVDRGGKVRGGRFFWR